MKSFERMPYIDDLVYIVHYFDMMNSIVSDRSYQLKDIKDQIYAMDKHKSIDYMQIYQYIMNLMN